MIRAYLALWLTEPSGLGGMFPAGTEGQPYGLNHGSAHFWGKALPKIPLLPPAQRISSHQVPLVCLLPGTGAESLRTRASLLAEGAGRCCGCCWAWGSVTGSSGTAPEEGGWGERGCLSAFNCLWDSTDCVLGCEALNHQVDLDIGIPCSVQSPALHLTLGSCI